MTKQCNHCLIEKDFSQFFKDKNHSSGRYSICKSCKKEKTYAWRTENRDRYNQTMSAYQRKNKLQMRLYRYGLSPDQYQKMLKDQDNKCLLCEQHPKGKRPLAIDHRHSDGKVRGLLCYGCNRAISILDKNEALVKAQAYIARFA